MIDSEYILREYNEKQRSTYEIANDLGTYPNAIRRTLLKLGVTLRDKSDSQKAALKNGRRTHPTRGKQRSEEDKRKIGQGVKASWDNINDADRKLRVINAQQRWNDMPDEKKKHLQELAFAALRKTAKDGSRLEKYLLAELRLRGYYIVFHKRNLLSREGLHVDLCIPDLRVAIEIDGPSHSLPVFGEAKLASTIVSDNAKTGLLINGGYTIIRVKNLSKNHSEVRYAHILTLLLNALKTVKRDNPQEIIIGDEDGK